MKYKIKNCLDCDKEISKDATRCRSCSKKGSKSSFYKNGKYLIINSCIDCGKKLSSNLNAKRCKSCESKNRFKNKDYKELCLKLIKGGN